MNSNYIDIKHVIPDSIDVIKDINEEVKNLRFKVEDIPLKLTDNMYTPINKKDTVKIDVIKNIYLNNQFGNSAISGVEILTTNSQLKKNFKEYCRQHCDEGYSYIRLDAYVSMNFVKIKFCTKYEDKLETGRQVFSSKLDNEHDFFVLRDIINTIEKVKSITYEVCQLFSMRY